MKVALNKGIYQGPETKNTAYKTKNSTNKENLPSNIPSGSQKQNQAWRCCSDDNKEEIRQMEGATVHSLAHHVLIQMNSKAVGGSPCGFVPPVVVQTPPY